MKKLFLFLGALSVSALLADNAAIQKTIKDNEGIDVKVIQSIPTNIKNLQIVSLEQPGGLRVPVLVSEDGKTIIGIPELLISSDEAFKDSLKKAYQDSTTHNKGITDKAILEIFKKYPNNVVKLAGKNKSKTTYMVIDLNCPYCYQEIQKLDTTLQGSNVELLVVGVLGMDSVKKAVTFEQDLKSKKTQQQKIDLLHAAFEKTYKPKENIDLSQMMQIAKELSMAGLRGTPYTIKR